MPLSDSEVAVNIPLGYIDVGDGCWRPNELVTNLRCWWPFQDVGDRFNTLKITNITKKVANIMILPPTPHIGHNHKVTNITRSPTSLSPSKAVYKDQCSPNNKKHFCLTTFEREAVHCNIIRYNLNRWIIKLFRWIIFRLTRLTTIVK